MRRFLTLLLTLAVLFISTTVASAKPTAWRAQHNRWANAQYCPGNWHTPFGARRVGLCEARLFGVSQSRVDCIATRESHWYYKAANPGSSARGLFQHMKPFWRGRWRTYAAAYGFYPGIFNGRTQSFVSIRIMKTQGFGMWRSTAHPC